MKTNIKEFAGTKIREKRIALNISQQDLADFLQLTRVSIMNIEKGRHFPSVTVLYAICCALNMQPNEIFPPVKPLKISTKKVTQTVTVTRTKKIFS